MNRAELIQFLLSSDSYPHSPERVVHIQTHASDVFIVSPYVYKVKKAVDFGFLDFSTLDKRKFYLEQELTLNRRLTQGIYLSVTEISINNGRLSFGTGGKTLEYALIMKELPKEYFLKSLLEKGEAGEPEFERIAEKLVNFYNNEARSADIDAFGAPGRIKPDVLDNIETSRQYTGKTLSLPALKTLEFYNRTFFDQKSSLFENRIKQGFIKDCHGDLHLEHINISPREINIYDCIEFNERFRYIDIASDTAFLAMDLDYNGRAGLSRFFISRVSELMPDDGIYGVLDFYKCYRATVRGKVLSINGYEKEVPEDAREQCLNKARRYFSLALRYALFGSRPCVIVTFGSIGTGKSTLSRALSKELSCPSFSSDYLRKQISGNDPYEKHYEPYGKGIYSKDVTEKVYSELMEKAFEKADTYGCVLVDASFSKLKYRDLLRCAALKKNIPVYFIQTKAPLQTVRQRLLNRELGGGSVSDGRLEILEQFTAGFEEPNGLELTNLLTIDTTLSEEEGLTRVLKGLTQINP